MGRWIPQIPPGKVETTDSPWEDENHRVTMGRLKQHSHHRKVETMKSLQEGRNHGVTRAG